MNNISDNNIGPQRATPSSVAKIQAEVKQTQIQMSEPIKFPLPIMLPLCNCGQQALGSYGSYKEVKLEDLKEGEYPLPGIFTSPGTVAIDIGGTYACQQCYDKAFKKMRRTRRTGLNLLKKDDIRIEFTKGTGSGGQHKNKTCSAVRVTHIPTGISAYQDGRDQHKNKKRALDLLEQRVQQSFDDEKAKLKKAHRDKKIHERNIIRTYNYDRGIVKDHRSKKTATIKNILDKGKLDLLR